MMTLADISRPIQLRRGQVRPLLSIGLLVAAYLTYDAADRPLPGLLLFGLTFASTLWLPPAVRTYLASLTLATLALSIMPLTTKYKARDFAVVIITMAGAVAFMYWVSHYHERQHLVHFNFDWQRRWQGWEVAYLFATVGTVYLLMPYYFTQTGAIHNWYFERHIGEIVAIFVSTMLIGIWEEFFFTATVLGVFRKYLPFFWANSLQAILFVGFLYGIGFRYWAPFGLFGYAWAQGWVFNKTKSLLFVLVVHICVDFLVCLVLLHAYYPDLARIFITGG